MNTFVLRASWRRNIYVARKKYRGKYHRELRQNLVTLSYLKQQQHENNVVIEI